MTFVIFSKIYVSRVIKDAGNIEGVAYSTGSGNNTSNNTSPDAPASVVIGSPTSAPVQQNAAYIEVQLFFKFSKSVLL